MDSAHPILPIKQSYFYNIFICRGKSIKLHHVYTFCIMGTENRAAVLKDTCILQIVTFKYFKFQKREPFKWKPNYFNSCMKLTNAIVSLEICAPNVLWLAAFFLFLLPINEIVFLFPRNFAIFLGAISLCQDDFAPIVFSRLNSAGGGSASITRCRVRILFCCSLLSQTKRNRIIYRKLAKLVLANEFKKTISGVMNWSQSFCSTNSSLVRVPKEDG